VPGTTSGRLIEAALELFGAQGFDAVSVTAIAARAGVTTGSLYHHFGHKGRLYDLVRSDVERRVLDRVEGAAAMRTIRSTADLAPALLVGFDYLVSSGYTRLFAETARHDAENGQADDQLEQLVDRLLQGRRPAVGYLVLAAWSAALRRAGTSTQDAADARAALAHLLAG
jgi:AcrR family transcriptional regulator